MRMRYAGIVAVLMLVRAGQFLVACGSNGQALADTAKQASLVTGSVVLTAPDSGQIVRGPFSAAVESSRSQYCSAPYVEYWLSDLQQYNQCLGTGWTAPAFPKTLTPPAGKFGYYRLTAKLYAYDSSGPPYGPFLLDTDYVTIIVDTD